MFQNTSWALLKHANLTQIESSIHLLRGKTHEALDNRLQACECYRDALRADVYCFEAFECLVRHQMMTSAEGWWTL